MHIRSSALVVAFALCCGALAAGVSHAAVPRCYGAASRDPLQPCENPALRLRVTPSPTQALLVPNAACWQLPADDVLRPCGFGTPRRQAQEEVALLGDSHAMAWRAALAPVARELGWHGTSITQSQCAFSRVVTPQAEAQRDACRRFNQQVIAWFGSHPEVTTVFVVADNVRRPGPRTRARGFSQAWKALPHTVRNIFVIRDNPRAELSTPDCIQRAMRTGVPAGPACALKRSTALRPDPAISAARRMHSIRVRPIDLSDFFCDAASCDPVIGGVLVFKDSNHLTREYASTLGPYVLRAMRPADTPS
jgi:SGNH domain (fused to AT3 domains)